tara:strand:- start:117 stop:359 length:243 start_codon:yes stop_codon:yes gene_type:complete
MNRKTKLELVQELETLQQTTADERTSLGEVLNKQQESLVWVRTQLHETALMLETYEKTILVLTKRLMEARKALNTPPPMQ